MKLKINMSDRIDHSTFIDFSKIDISKPVVVLDHNETSKPLGKAIITHEDTGYFATIEFAEMFFPPLQIQSCFNCFPQLLIRDADVSELQKVELLSVGLFPKYH
jgi:hypothetical protein